MNVTFGNAVTVICAASPIFTLPMSASSTDVSTCMSARFVAMVNRVGVDSEAATVCPTVTFRAITIPSTGLLMIVWLRLYCAW